MSLPATAPLRSKEDVQRCLNALNPGVDLVLTMTKAQRNPWFNMVTADQNSKVGLIAKESGVQRRQDAPECFDLTTIAYVARPEFVLNTSSMWEGNVKGVEVPVERAIDIDSPIDFSIARFLLENWDPSELLIP